MKLPRDLSGKDLIKSLKVFDYQVSRQTGSHIRLTTEKNGVHHVTVPNHDPMRVGTLSAVLEDVAKYFEITRQDLIEKLFKHQR